jgi:outer membrane protein OmpA-like peptidoglycan-associated protein
MILRRRAAGGRFCRPSHGRGQLPLPYGSAGRPLALRRSALVLILLLAPFGCQSVDEHPDGSASTPAAPADDAYPSLHSVPPRPQLSYPVRQQREIVGELLADRTNARYTEQVIRYRTGLSSLPPPPAPPAAARKPIAEAVIAEAPPRSEPGGTQPEPMEQQAPPRNVAEVQRGNLDDGSLDDMIEDMVVDAEDNPRATPPAEADLAPSAGRTPETAPPARAPPQQMESETGPVNRLFDWLGGLLGEEDRASVAAGPSPEASGGRPLAVAAADPPADPVEPEGAPDARPIEPVAGVARANDAPVASERTAGSTPADPPEPAGQPVVVPAARPMPEAATITVTTSGVEIAPPEPAGDPDPGVIAFARGSAALPPGAVPKLERLLAEASAEQARITVLGEGSPPSLAIDRARAVGQALVRLGASADRLRITMATNGAGDRARLVLAGSSGR